MTEPKVVMSFTRKVFAALFSPWVFSFLGTIKDAELILPSRVVSVRNITLKIFPSTEI